MLRHDACEDMLDFFSRCLGFSELSIAVEKGDMSAVHSLIQSGLDLNRQETKWGITPIYKAIGNPENAPMIEELIRAGADPNVKNEKPETPQTFPFATPLIYAMYMKNLKGAEALLNNGADIHARVYETKITALHVAVELGFEEGAKLLIERGIDVNVRNSLDETALHIAVKAGKTQIVPLLLAKGADISATCTIPRIIEVQNPERRYTRPKWELNVTPVFLAALYGHLDIVNILINAHADMNVKTSENHTVLHFAARDGRLKLVNMLLNAGAGRSVNVQSNYKGYTPLLFAAEAGQTNTVKALLKVEGIETDVTSTSMETPLVVAISNGHHNVVEALVTNGVPVNSRVNNVTTLLHIALTAKKDNVVEFLIAHDADIHATDATNETPLHVACKEGVSLKIVTTLIEKGANVDARNDDDITPLHHAVEGNYPKIMKLLIYHGADCSVSNKENWTVLHIAASRGSMKMVAHLTTKVSDIDVMSHSRVTPLHCAVEGGHREVVEVLLKSNANVNAQDVAKRTPLHIALEKGHVEIAVLVLRHNILVNLKEENEGYTPLFLAVKNKHEKLISLLLDKGADVNAANKSGVLPIHAAAKAESVDIVKVLLARGSYYNVKAMTDDYSGTPLELARNAGNAKLIILLEIIRKLFSAVIKNNTDQILLCVQAGAIVNARKANGHTALHYAVSNYNSDAVKALLKNDADIFLATDKSDLPLQVALASGCTNISEIILAHAKNLSFIKHNSVVNAKTVEHGSTVLHIATEKNQFHIVKFLLANGAVYNAKNNAGKMPVELTSDEEIKNLLFSAEKLFEAVKKKNGLKEVMQLLEYDNSAINAREADNGGTPLYWSVCKGYSDIANTLLSNDADYCLVTNEGSTPLHVAASEGNIAVVKALVNHANNNARKTNNFLNAATTKGTVALHVAANLEIVKCLLQAGARYDIHNSEEKTALELTQNDNIRRLLKTTRQLFEDVQKGLFTVINVLNGLKMEEFKAVMSTRNVQGQTLVQEARANGHTKIANKLQEKLKKLG